MARGMVAWSSGSGSKSAKKEQNPCNVSLALEAYRIFTEEQQNTGDKVIMVAQWEVAAGLRAALGLHLYAPYVVEKHRQTGEYLDSREVMAQAADIFRGCGITEVIVVANPFLHLYACRQIVHEFGFTPIKRKVRWIGFCKDSLQWWTRGPIRCLAYSVMQKLWGRRGR